MSLVERIRAQKRENEREEEKSSLLSENMGLADRIRNRASIDADSLERDIKNFEAELKTAKSWWHNAEDMSNLRSKAENIQSRVNSYANSGSHIKGLDANSLVNKYSTVLDDIDILSNKYSMYESKDAYKPTDVNRDELISIGKSKQNIFSDNPSIQQMLRSENDNGIYDLMTDDEKNEFYYQTGKLGTSGGNEYLKGLDSVLKKRAYESSASKMKESSESSAVASVANNLASSLGVGYGYVDDLLRTATRRDIDEYNIGHLMSEIEESSREATKQHARETFGESAVTDFLVDTGLSIGQSAVRLPLGNVGLAVAGLGAATQGAESARERGASDWQALFAGGAQGIAEAAMERVSFGGLEKILTETPIYTVKDIVKNTLKQMGREAGEESLTEFVNTISDLLIMGDKSEAIASMNDYIANGYDVDTARNKVIGDVFKNTVLSGLGGALSGGVMGGTFSGINAYGQYTAGKNSNITDYNEFAESLDTDPESYENAKDLEKVENLKAYAQELADAQAKGEKVTNLQKGAFERDLYNMENDLIESQKANDPEVKREKRVESLKKGEVTEVTSTGNSTRLDGLRFKDGKTMLQTSEGEYAAEDMTLTQNDAELVSYAESMSEEKANLLVAQYDGKTNIGDYVESFNLAYSYGETGFGTDFVLKNKGVLTERQALNAYKEATMAKARKNAEAFENAVDKTITREMLGGRFDDSIIDYDGSGKGTVKWNMLTSSEKMNINAAKVIAGAMKNTRFEFIESRVENGEYKGENARWNPTTRTISIDVHAGRNKLTDENSYIMSAMSHEITHSFERTAAEEYANLRDHVMNYLANRDGIDASELIARKRMQIGDSHAKRGIELTDEKVINEIVADACEEMLVNSNKVDEYLNGMDENTKKSFIRKVKETFENIIKAINEVIKKLDPRTKEARALRESKEDFEKALELWDKAFAKANEATEENTTAKEFIEQAVVQLSARTDGKMGLDATVEQTDGLVAVHNLTEDKLEKTFKLEGFPMPSIAITKAALGHSDFGSISFIFGKDTINPSKKKNKVYGADAWTPTFPRVEYEANFGRIREIKSDLNPLIDKLPERIRNSAKAFLSGLEYNLDNYGGYEGVVDRALNDEAIKQLYLAATDNVVEDIMIEKRTEMHEVDVEISKNILDSIDVDIVGVSKKSGREIFEEYGQLIKNAMKKAYLANGISAETADNVIEKTNKSSIVSQLRTARDYKLNGGVKVENVLDYSAISKEINSRIDSAKYEKWVKETFDGIVKNEGIYNGKDYFTPSGNRKSFAQTHFPVTADNIVKAMIAQNDDVRNVSGFNGIKSIRAMAVEEFKSIKSIKQAKNKLKNIDSIEYEAMNEKLSKRLYGVIESILESSNRSSGNSYVDMDNIGFSILDTCANPTVENIRKILEGYHWTCSESQAKEINSIIEEVADMPVNMFEAKPQRVVGFNEILCAIVPNDISEKTRKLISDKGIPLREYESGNDESRLKVLNSLEGVQFSDRISTEEQLSTFNLDGKWNDYIGVQKEVIPVLRKEGFFDNNEVINEESGMIVRINSKGIKETLGSGKRFQTLPRELKEYKVATLRSLPNIIRTGHVIEDEVDNIHVEDGYKFAYIGNEVEIDGKPVNVRVSIKKRLNSNQFWIHNIDENKKGAELLSPSNKTDYNETHHLNSKVTQNSDDVKVQFSDRYEDTFFELFDSDGTFAASSAIIEEDVDRLKQRLSMGASSMSDDNIKMIAKHLLQKADSRYDFEELSDDLKDIYGYIENHDYFEGNALIAKCNDVARRILSEQKETKVTNDYAKMVLKEIRNTKIKLDAEQIAEAKNRYGEKYRNALFGRITISNEGVSLDSKWADWSAQYPDIFDANISSANQITELADIYDSLREASEVKQRFDSASDVRALGAEIYNQYWIRSTISAESEKNQQKIKELNLKHRNAMKKLREDYQKRLENQRFADSMHYGKIINEIRQRNKDEVKKAKKLGKEHMDAYKDRVARNAKIEQITKNALTLNDWLRKNSKDQHIPEVMKTPVSYLLKAIDFSSKQLLGMRNGYKPTPTNKDISLSEALEQVRNMVVDAHEAQLDEEFIMDFPPNMQDELRALSANVNNIMRTVGNNAYVLNQMSLEDLEALNKIIKTIKHSVTKLNNFFAVKHSAGVANLSQKSMSDMKILGKHVDSTGKISKAANKLLKWGNITPYYAFKRFGEGGVAVYEALQSGWDTFAFHVKDIIDYSENAYTEKEVKEWSESIKTFEVLEPVSDAERKTPGYTPRYQKIQMTDAQIMSLYCLQKREQAKGHLVGGGIRPTDIENGKKVISQPDGAMLSESDIDTIINSLTPRQIEVADKLQEFMNTTCTDWGNEVSMERFGFKAFGEENYFPIQSDKNNLAVDDAVEQNSLYRLLNMSFTKGTIKNANNRVLIGNIFDVFAQHTSDMAKYNALALPVLDAFKWFNYKEKEFKGDTARKERSLKQAMEYAFGKDALSYFTTFMRDLNGEKNVGRDSLSGIFFTNAKLASVAGNIRVVALQPTSYVRASAVIDPKYLARAFMYKPKMDKAEKHCGIALWKSLGYYDTNIQRGVAEQIKHDQTKKDKAIEHLTMLAEKADKVTWGYLWNACELEVRDKRKDLSVGSDEFYAEIGRKLREIIYATQVVDSTMTRSAMMRSSDGWDKMMTSFMSEPTIAYNMLADTYMGWKLTERETGSKQKAFKKHGKKMARVLTAYTVTNMVAALVEAWFDIFRDDEEMTEEAFIEAYLENLKSDMNPLNKIPYVKEVTSLLEGFSSSRTDTQWLQYLVKTGEGIQKHLEGKGNVYTTAKNAMRAFSYATGLPIYNLWRDTMAAFDKAGILTDDDLDEFFNDTIGGIFPSLKSK